MKFLVAAPRTTVDLHTADGDAIVIEERPGKEVSMIRGPRFDGVAVDASAVETIAIAAEGIDIWNPAFDVTPKELIDGIITEVGVAVKDSNGEFHLGKLFEGEGIESKVPTVGGM